MATAAEWLAGARPQTLPAAVAPVAAGTGAAAAADGFAAGPALGALAVALALQVGVNYANDYSDGIRGTDAERVGPLRLVGSQRASAAAVRAAAIASFALAAAVGLALSAVTSWWLVAIGAACIAAAWTYTGGHAPYGYRGLGEVAVFVFFGLVATVGTTYVQAGTVTGPAVVAGVGCGALACALLVANNLRDLAADAAAGKRTLAVRLGDRRTRRLYVGLLVLAYLLVLGLGATRLPVLLTLISAAAAVPAGRAVLRGATGPALVPVLQATGRCLLGYGVLLGATLAFS